jgi:hypothetical protein
VNGPVGPGLVPAITGALVMAGVSTAGDLVWYGFQLPHRVVYGLLHGTLLCAAIGAYLGAVARELRTGAIAGGLIGFLSAGAYYVLAPLAGRVIMFLCWVGLWLLFAALSEYLSRTRVRWGAAAGRAALAALASGLTFYAISGIWSSSPVNGRDYAWHFLAWTLAFLPAFLALLWRPFRDGRRAGSG